MEGKLMRGWIRSGVCVSLLLGACGTKSSENKSPKDDPGGQSLATNDPSGEAAVTPPTMTLEAGGYEVVLRFGEASTQSRRIEVIKDGNTYWSHAAPGLEIVESTRDGKTRIEPGSDVTGDGLANLLLRDHRGSETHFQIIRLGQEVEVLADLVAGDGTGQGFEDLDGDGVMECLVRDGTWSDVLGNDGPTVVLRWDGSEYRASGADMARPPESIEDLEPTIDRLVMAQSWEQGNPPKELWSTALDLAFAGHEDLAVHLIGWAWPEGQTGREAFIERFRSTLAQSPYYPQIAG